MAFPGSPREVAPFEVVQLIATGRKTGVLTVTGAGDRVSLYLRSGQICHATSGDLQGE